MSKAFNKFLRNAAAQGIYVGDINQATQAFQGGGYPTLPVPAPPAPPPMIKAPKQSKATQASVGQGVRRPKKANKKTRLSDLRISRPKVNTALSVGSGGTGLNIGGY